MGESHCISSGSNSASLSPCAVHAFIKMTERLFKIVHALTASLPKRMMSSISLGGASTPQGPAHSERQ